jgi:hypothetical protein
MTEIVFCVAVPGRKLKGAGLLNSLLNVAVAGLIGVKTTGYKPRRTVYVKKQDPPIGIKA